MEIKYDRDYFMDRGLEPKHWIFVPQWVKEFEPETVFDYGCGRGPFVHCFNYFNIFMRRIFFTFNFICNNPYSIFIISQQF